MTIKKFFKSELKAFFQSASISGLMSLRSSQRLTSNTCDVTWLTTKRNNRVLKCDVIKNQNCEIMRFVGTF